MVSQLRSRVASHRATRRALVVCLACCWLASSGLPAVAPTGRARAAEPARASKARLPGLGRAPIRRASLAADDAEADPLAEHIKAPSLDGGTAWINTGGPIDLKQLRGKFVVLDFWTYCCINCMHILPVLKKIEHTYPNNVVVIGVHSAKFEAEKDSQNILDAVLRYEIEHPVINDRDHKLWDKFGVTSWPACG